MKKNFTIYFGDRFLNFERNYFIALIVTSIFMPFQEYKNIVKEKNQKKYAKTILGVLQEKKPEQVYSLERMYSFSPVRSKPNKVYLPIKERNDPEGFSIYMHLNNIYNSAEWKLLQEKT